MALGRAERAGWLEAERLGEETDRGPRCSGSSAVSLSSAVQCQDIAADLMSDVCMSDISAVRSVSVRSVTSSAVCFGGG